MTPSMFVMPGPDPGIHVLTATPQSKTWMAGTYAKLRFALSPAMTRGEMQMSSAIAAGPTARG
jgi:hypothetical protein